MLRIRRFFLLGIYLPYRLLAIDTLSVTLHEADSIFQINNIYLLAATMAVEAQRAQVIHAKLYPNPVFTAEINVYDPENNKTFHAGATGQKVFQVEQLIILGGKRKAEIELAKTNTDIAELELMKLLRHLKFKLHTALFTTGQQQQLLQRYNGQLALLDSLLAAYEKQVTKDNIPLKELVRLKGVYLNLNNERATLLKEYYETQSTLQTLLQSSSVISFRFSENDITKYIKSNSLSDMKNEALNNRPELLLARKNLILAQQYLQYQKRSVIPDMSFFAQYDQRGGAFINQINAGIAIPIPIWHRNQGNIKTAQYRIMENDYLIKVLENEIFTEIQNSYTLYEQTVSEYIKAQTLYNNDFEITMKGMTDNFQKRNISIIEFIDFFEAYNQTLAEVARIKTQLVLSAETLNLIIGKDLY